MRWWSRWRPMVAYDLACHLLTVALFAPLGGWVLSAVVRRSGDSVVSNTDLVSFFLSPAGLTLLVGSAILGLALLFLELGGLSVLILGSYGGRRVSAMGALRLLARRARGLVELASMLALRLGTVAAVALGGVVLVKTLLLSDGDIYYYLQARPDEFLWAAAAAFALLAAVLLICFVIVVRWIVALPILLVEDGRAGEAVSVSRDWVSAFGLAGVVRRLVVWALVVGGLGMASGALGWAFERLAFALAGDSIPRVLAATGGLVAVDLLLGLVVGIAAAITFSRLMIDLYLVCRPGVTAPTPVFAGPGDPEQGRRARIGLAVASGVALLLIAGLAIGASLVGRIDLDHVVDVTAHRGSARSAPENTLAALERAIEDGADYAEIDVQEIADGSLVLFHDTDLRRIAGIDRNTWEMTLGEFRQLDVGAWFAEEFAGERVATLEEAIETARGRMGLNIELKLNGHERRLEESVASIVRESGFADQSFATSLDRVSLERLAEVDDTLRRGLIVAAKVGDATRLGVDVLAVNAGRVDRDLIARAHRAGQEVHVWTVNEPERMLSMIHLGVDNILTSAPDVLVELQATLSGMSELQRTLLYVSDLMDGRL